MLVIDVEALPEIPIPAPELRGNNFYLGQCQDLEVCMPGPAGTGKTFAILYKIHCMLLAYPGSRVLVARKYNTDLAGSALVTYREEILNEHEDVRYFGGSKAKPPAYIYPNGSEMIINGLDKPEKIKSMAFDLIYINEATECSLNDIEMARSRLRHGKMPYHQLILDCNPDGPNHWLNLRMNEGTTTRLETRHEDNPAYYDIDKQEWTAAGENYIYVVLAGLTGVRLARLRWGLWQAAEGTVYEDSWSRLRCVVDPRPIPREWPRYLAIDFGFTNPFVCLWAAKDPDGRLIIYRQIYKTKTRVEDHAHTIALASGWYHKLPTTHPRYAMRPAEWADPLPREVICDHDADGRATLEAHLGLIVTKARKTIGEGIQAVAARFCEAGDGRARVEILNNSLYERDEELAKSRKPMRLEDEPEMYAWKRGADLSEKEEPVDANNHGLDALRYLVAHFDLQESGVAYMPSLYR